MQTTRLSTKGQVILPKNIRTAHVWGPGTEFAIEETTSGILLRPVLPVKKSSLDAVVGCLVPKRKASSRGPKSLAQMDTAITREIRRRHDRGRY